MHDISLESAVGSDKKIVSIDISANSNDILVALILKSLQQISRKPNMPFFSANKRYLLVVENIDLMSNENWRNVFAINNENKFLISTKDVFSGNKNAQETFLQFAEKLIVFKHSSLNSYQGLSNYFGNYKGFSPARRYEGFFKKKLYIDSWHEETKPRIPFSVLSTLNDNQACVYNSYGDINKWIAFIDILL